jgi:PTH1 family peptidyl-tRNA hydrolase
MLPKSKPKLVVGLGNPGEEYKYTRHNVGAWFVHALGHRYGAIFRADKKFQGELSEVVVKGYKVRLLFPTTFMNLCGVSIRAVCDYYQIEPEEVLVAHDELDLDVGDIRLKFSGGHGGHNGLRDTSQHLGKDYWRLRIGVGHPGNKKQVSNFLTKNKTPRKEEEIILVGIENMVKDFEYLMSEGYEKTMHKLHSKESALDKEKTENKKKVYLSKKDKKVKDAAGRTSLAIAFAKAKLEEE